MIELVIGIVLVLVGGYLIYSGVISKKDIKNM